MEPLINAGPSPEELIKDSSIQSFAEDVIQASQDVPVIVDFWATWCGPCKQLTPALEKAVTEARGKVKLVKIDIDRNQELAAQLRIQSVPTVIGFVGGRPADAFAGAVPESEIKAFIDRLVKQAGGAQNGAQASPVDQALAQANQALGEGNAEAAGQIFSQILQAEPEHAGALGGLAQTHVKLGNIEEAKSVLANVPDDQAEDAAVAAARAAIELADQAASAGDTDELAGKVEADPDNHQARFDLALALQAAGRREDAADQLIELFRRDAQWNDGAARSQLVKMFEAAGPNDPFTATYRRKLSSIMFQ